MRFLFLLIFLVGCESSHENITGDYLMPPELKDCKVFYLSASNMSKSLYVVRCPNSLTNTTWTETCGKNCVRDVATSIQQ